MELTICSVRYLDKNQTKPLKEIHKNYLREQISHYGIDVEYFRNEANWFKTAGMQTPKVQNYIYGDAPNAGYKKIADMVIYMEIFNDDAINTKWGFTTNSEATVHILIDDFTHSLRNVLGYETCQNVSIPVSTNVTRFNGNLTGCTTINTIQNLNFSKTLNYNDFNYYCNNTVYPKSNIEINTTTCDNLTQIANTIQMNYVYNSPEYNNASQLKCYNLSATIPIPNEIKRYGSGVLCGNLTGNIIFFSEYNEDSIMLRPLPGDFFRIQFDDYNHLEYEISEIINQNLTAGGMNPLLARYTWQCKAFRRQPSFETVDSINQSEEKLEIPNKERENNAVEIVSDRIHDYACRNNYVNDVDDVNSDSVYGGAGKIDFTDQLLVNNVDDYTPPDLLCSAFLNHINNIFNS